MRQNYRINDKVPIVALTYVFFFFIMSELLLIVSAINNILKKEKICVLYMFVYIIYYMLYSLIIYCT